MELIIPRKLHAMVATEWSLPELASQATLASMIAEDGRDASRWILALSKAGCTASSKHGRSTSSVRRWRRARAPMRTAS